MLALASAPAGSARTPTELVAFIPQRIVYLGISLATASCAVQRIVVVFVVVLEKVIVAQGRLVSDRKMKLSARLKFCGTRPE